LSTTKELYIVSTPIGNYDDITLRALKVLKSVDLIICEEYKPARRLLAHYEISKELFAINEHNESELADEALDEIDSGKIVALITDAGTPLFSDPGTLVVKRAIERGIKIIPVPGASSILSALVGSGFEINNFYYYGWLSPKKEIRREQLFKLKSFRELIILMETPYRLKALLTDIKKVFGKNKNVVVAYKLTQDGEKFLRDSVEKILNIVEKEGMKGEFVLLIDNRETQKRGKRSTL